MKALTCVFATLVLAGCGSVASATNQVAIQSRANSMPIRLISAGCYNLASGQAVSFTSPADGLITLNAHQGVRLVELDRGGADKVEEIERSFNAETGAVSYIAELDRGDDYLLSNAGGQSLRYCYQVG